MRTLLALIAFVVVAWNASASPAPTGQPTNVPSGQPSHKPSNKPSDMPSSAPSYKAESWGQVTWDKRRHRQGGFVKTTAPITVLVKQMLTVIVTQV